MDRLNYLKECICSEIISSYSQREDLNISEVEDVFAISLTHNKCNKSIVDVFDDHEFCELKDSISKKCKEIIEAISSLNDDIENISEIIKEYNTTNRILDTVSDCEIYGIIGDIDYIDSIIINNNEACEYEYEGEVVAEIEYEGFDGETYVDELKLKVECTILEKSKDDIEIFDLKLV